MNENEELRGMTALVTGASKGIGAETARVLAARGAYTIIHYNSGGAEACQVLESIRGGGGDGTVLQAELSTSEGVHHLICALESVGRPIDILVNNAGSLIKRTRFLDLTEELWTQVFMLNLDSAFLISQACLKGMVTRRKGVVVNVSSAAARFGGGLGAIAYSSAKAALSTMTKGLAREFAPNGIRINGVSPGTVDTNYHRQFSTQQGLKAVAEATPMGRMGTSAEVAEVIAFLCSERARFVQGQMIEVNGGFLMV